MAIAPQSYEEIKQEMLKALQKHYKDINSVIPNKYEDFATDIFDAMVESNKLIYELMNTLYPISGMSQTMWWIYPDGSKSSTKPRDGQVSRHNSGNNIVEYMWDGTKEQWHCTGTIFLNDPVPLQSVEFVITIPADKCECGSEKVGSPIHSSWCAKYTK